MDQFEKELLTRMKQKRIISLEGNREFFINLTYFAGYFLLNYGNSMNNEVTSSEIITENEALKKMKDWLAERTKKKLSSTEDYLKEWEEWFGHKSSFM